MNDGSKFVFEVADGEARVTAPPAVRILILDPDGQHRTTRCSGDEQIPEDRRGSPALTRMDRRIGGVFGGLAQRLRVAAALLRLGYVVTIVIAASVAGKHGYVVYCLAVLIYLLAWRMMPGEEQRRRRKEPPSSRVNLPTQRLYLRPRS